MPEDWHPDPRAPGLPADRKRNGQSRPSPGPRGSAAHSRVRQPPMVGRQQLRAYSRPCRKGVSGVRQNRGGPATEGQGERDSGCDLVGIQQNLPQAQLGPKQRLELEG